MLKLKSSTIDRLIGMPFFYADEETGIGWTSKIDSIERNYLSDSYTVELSCGTLVEMDRIELANAKNLSELTNLRK